MAVFGLEHESRHGSERDRVLFDVRPGTASGHEYAFFPESDIALGLHDLLGVVVDDLLALELP